MRLIDADKLKKILKDDSGTPLENALMGIIDAQTTAFDLESVIEQIETKILENKEKNIITPI